MFLSFSYSYYCFSQPQTATNSIISFRLGSLLSNETIFTFLRASNAEKSSCDPDALQSRMTQFFSQTSDLQTISALVQVLLCLTNLCFLEATIGQIRCHSTFSEPVRGVKRHTSGLEGSVCAFIVRLSSNGVAPWEMLFLVCFEDGEWRTHLRPG